MIKRLVVSTILLVSFLSAAGIALARSIEESAWQRALKLAQATTEEATKWKRPEVIISPKRRYVPIGPRDGYRICGEMRSALEGDRPDLTWDVKIYVYARPNETSLIRDALTHEMLHAIYLYRMIDNPAMDGSGSEEYVISLLPTECNE